MWTRYRTNKRECWNAALCIILNCKDSWFQILQKALNWLQVLLSASFQILYCTFHSFDMFQTFWRNPVENIRAAKWQTVAVGISKIPGMSAARLAELLRRFKRFGCNRKGHFRGKKRGIYMEVKMFNIGKHISNTEAATVSLPPFWGCHLLLRRPNKKTRGKKWHAKSQVTKRTRRGDLTSERVRTSPPRDLTWVRRRNFGEATTSERNCCIPTLPERRFCEAAMFCEAANFATLGLQASEADFKRLREESLALWLSLLRSIIIIHNHFW